MSETPPTKPFALFPPHPQAYHDAWVQQHGGASLAHRAAAAEAAALLDPASAADAAAQLLQAGTQGGSHADCVAAEELLGGRLGATAAAEQWRAACAARFPWSRHFGGAAVVPLPAAAAAEVNGVAEKVAALEVTN